MPNQLVTILDFVAPYHDFDSSFFLVSIPHSLAFSLPLPFLSFAPVLHSSHLNRIDRERLPNGKTLNLLTERGAHNTQCEPGTERIKPTFFILGISEKEKGEGRKRKGGEGEKKKVKKQPKN
jgi:hypothetical protein